MAVLLTAPLLQFFDNNGDPLSGGSIYTYEAGTTTPKATYTDSSEATPNSNPVVLDSAGRAPIWINGSYKIVIKDSDGNTISTTDDVTSFNTSSTTIDEILPTQTGNSGKFLTTNGTNASWGTPSVPTIAALTNKVLYGLTLSNNGTDATNDIDIAAGSCISDDGTTQIDISAITKRLDAAWAVGSGNGGLDTGTIADTTYHVWAIKRTDTGVTDVLFSASASSPTMPSNYTKKKCIGSFIRSGGSILAFSQNGNRFYLSTPLVTGTATNPGTSAVTRATGVPTGVKFTAMLTAMAYNGTNNITLYVSSLDQADVAPQAPGTSSLTAPSTVIAGYGSTAWAAAPVNVVTDTSAQVRTRVNVSGAADRIGLITNGWIDPRI